MEFQSEASIRARYPDGVRALADGGTHDTIASQPTDDSEMALMLARSIVRARRSAPRLRAMISFRSAQRLDDRPPDHRSPEERLVLIGLDDDYKRSEAGVERAGS